MHYQRPLWEATERDAQRCSASNSASATTSGSASNRTWETSDCTTRSAKKSECKELKQVSGNLNKATDIAEEPRALPVAQNLVVLIEAMRDVYCK